MITAYARSEGAVDLARRAVAEVPAAEAEAGIPQLLIDWLARLRLLEGVPFAYLVPDERLLPRESIRFFYLNRDWTDAAVDGALSLGMLTTRDHAQLHTTYQDLRAAVDLAERQLWARRLGEPEPQGPAEIVTGLLLRSRAVSGWPGLHVRAFRAEGESDVLIRLLRVERLAPAVLFALIDGVPDRVDIEEPRQGLQFGVDDDPDTAGRYRVEVRDPNTGERIAGQRVGVPFRAGAPGVIDLTTLRDRLSETPARGPNGSLSPAEFGLQMVQLPFRQRFGRTAGEEAEPSFEATISMEEVRLSVGLEVR
jgi:hypothetical protein